MGPLTLLASRTHVAVGRLLPSILSAPSSHRLVPIAAGLVPRTFSTTPFQMASPRALLLLADGAEEMETVITIDILRRAGVNVTVAGLNGAQPVKCGLNVNIVPDVALDAAGTDYDAVILPGGMGGTEALKASKAAGSLLQAQEKSGKLVAAICAAPLALQEHGIGKGKNITCYPALSGHLESDSNYKYSQERVVVDGNLITSRGPGTAFDFALAVAEKLSGPEKVAQICPEMLYQRQ